jgi:hypothetical protein
MRVEWCLLMLGLSGPVLATETTDADAPDAALLEFLADWPDDDRQWLENEMDIERTEDAIPIAPIRETHHD